MRRIITCLILLFCSCQKVVTLKLDNAPPQLVIEGNITDTPGPDTVKVMLSANFYGGNSFPGVSGATVTVSDNTGANEALTEITPGVYITHTLQGHPGNTYHLSVVIGDTVYTASSTMPQPVELDSITFTTSTRFRNGQITAIANFQDPPGIANYYRYAEHINGGLYTRTFLFYSDRLSDGRYIQDNLVTDSVNLQNGDLLQLDMFCVDENDYNYFSQLYRTTSTGAFGTDVSPANPSTNISNGAYGYFSAHTVRSKTVTVD